jgi:hypothetical protein
VATQPASSAATAAIPDTATARRYHRVRGMSRRRHQAKPVQAASAARANPMPTIVSYDRWVRLTGGRSSGGALSRPITSASGSRATSSESPRGMAIA